MTFPPDGAARSLCVAADEALTEAAFCTGDFAAADRLFTQAQALAAGAGDWAGRRSPPAAWGWCSITATSAS
jgi:hypothetical protein